VPLKPPNQLNPKGITREINSAEFVQHIPLSIKQAETGIMTYIHKSIFFFIRIGELTGIKLKTAVHPV
jgi:hypothetical protein